MVMDVPTWVGRYSSIPTYLGTYIGTVIRTYLGMYLRSGNLGSPDVLHTPT